MSFREDLRQQVVHIRRYRRRISRPLRREVSIEEAAERWIERHAGIWRRYHPLAA